MELIVIREDVVIVSSLKSKEGYGTEEGKFISNYSSFPKTFVVLQKLILL